ncbi:MAG: hypothetical protein WAO19_00320 [Candidatus Kryptoniota bacterium]
MNISKTKAKKIDIIVGLIFAFAYCFLGIDVIVTDYGSTGFLYNLGSYLVAVPWSKLWDFGGPLEYSGKFNIAILNGAGVVINSVIIFFTILYAIKFVAWGINKLKRV